MNTYAKIRAALEQAGDYIRSDLASERGAFEGYEGVSRIDEIKVDLANNSAALAALAELEKAASEVVAWIIGKPTHGHDIGRYLVWNAGHVPHSVGGAAEPLYAAPPVPAGMVELREPTEDECERIDAEFHRLLNRDETSLGRDIFDAVSKWLKGEL